MEVRYMVDIIKKNESKQEFDPEKIKTSISKAVTDSGANVEDKKEMIEKISNEVIEAFKDKDEIKSSEVREMVLKKLTEADETVANAWKKFEEKKTSTTE
jgi:transcriptional regulator NrdR family protein